MKRILTFILLLIFIATAVFASAAQLDVTMPDKGELTDGKYHVTVEISDNPGFASLQLELFYNDNVLTCEKIVTGEVINNMLSAANPNAKGSKTSAILSVAGTENTYKDGVIATFVFDKPDSGDPKLDFEITEIRTEDGAYVDVNLDISDNYGYVEDSSDEDDKTASDKTDSDKDSSNKNDSDSKDDEDDNKNDDKDKNDDDEDEESKNPYYVGDDDDDDIILPEEVKVTEDEKTPAVKFWDVEKSHWAHDYIYEAVSLGIINGYTDGTFVPNKAMTRAEFATILWNMNEKPESGASLSFGDVTPSDWYYDQIAWAYDNGYINGTSESSFTPSGTITREQAMTILYRCSGSPDASYDIDKFSDASDISDYAVNAMKWALSEGIISGVDDSHIAPNESATRAQLSTIIVRYLNTID